MGSEIFHTELLPRLPKEGIYILMHIYIYIYMHARVYITHTHVCMSRQGTWAPLHSKTMLLQQPREGSRRVRLCRAGSWVWQLRWLQQWPWEGAASGSRSPLPCKREESSCKPPGSSPPWPWVHPGAGSSSGIQAGAPAQGLTQNQPHRPANCRFPCTTQLSSCSGEFQFISHGGGGFFPLLKPRQGC